MELRLVAFFILWLTCTLTPIFMSNYLRFERVILHFPSTDWTNTLILIFSFSGGTILSLWLVGGFDQVEDYREGEGESAR